MDERPLSAHRRRDVSRVEGFSDAVFAFAITLLVVSLEVPKTFHELVDTIRGLPAFAVCFALLFQVWWRHYRFFRAYDLEDGYVVAVTGVLLFVVLFYVYPLKFVWTLSFAQLQGQRVGEVTAAQAPLLFALYGAGVIAVFSLLALLYRHAYRRRDALSLSALEILDTRLQIYRNVATAAVGGVSIALAAVLGAVAPRAIGASGLIYFALAFVEGGIGRYGRRERRRLDPAAND